jgi:hypothetical protein
MPWSELPCDGSSPLDTREARLTGELVAILATALAASSAAKDLLHEFTISHRIYRLNEERSPDSNLVRAELLKQHFLASYTRLKHQSPAPRIFFKPGDNHTGKGFNYTHELNLGNFVAELAAGEQHSPYTFSCWVHAASISPHMDMAVRRAYNSLSSPIIQNTDGLPLPSPTCCHKGLGVSGLR